MSEPVTLYRGNETVTTCAPSEVRRLQAEGWAFGKAVTEVTEVVTEVTEPDPQAAPKRGRKTK